MKQWWRTVRVKVLPIPIFLLARFIGLTLRLQIEGFERYRNSPDAHIFAGWHGRTFIAANFFKGKGIWTIISQSRDGEMQNRVFRLFGFNTIRGSTGRGGVRAAVESVKILRKGNSMAFTPDGPRGPSGIVQPGIMMMAQRSGALLVPVGVSARWRWLAPAWDKYMIPLPFSKAIMIYGDPIRLAEDATEADVEVARLQLERQLHELEELAERRMGHS